MLAASDPATFVALILLLLLLLTAVRLHHVRQQRREGRRRLAMATGHPSTLGRVGSWADRRAIAMGLAHQLAAAGLISERRDGQPIVRARGLSGEYVLTVMFDQILVEYETPDGRLDLGEHETSHAAVLAVTRHAELPAPV